MKYKDYYAILEIEHSISQKDIGKAFRNLARRWHPDANANNSREAEEKFKDIQEAYEVLGDPYKRKKYDLLDPTRLKPSTARRARKPGEENLIAFEEDLEEATSGFSQFFEVFFS
jgi:DnaJ-class molecular chaperone